MSLVPLIKLHAQYANQIDSITNKNTQAFINIILFRNGS